MQPTHAEVNPMRVDPARPHPTGPRSGLALALALWSAIGWPVLTVVR
jgi:hypothetical protein